MVIIKRLQGVPGSPVQGNVSLGEHKDGGEEMKIVYTPALSQTRILTECRRAFSALYNKDCDNQYFFLLFLDISMLSFCLSVYRGERLSLI